MAMGFKEDADFARFVSMGAVGAAAVAEHLRVEHQHMPIELERYAMANKVWQTKVKRLRLPDLVCTRCGRRVESRAKSKLGVVLSHSDAPGRGWDAGGMRDDDLYAFLRADLSVFPPRVGRPAFFECAALRNALDRARRSAPKAASEGSEVTLTWPTWVPAKSGIFRGIDDEGRLVCEWEDGTAYRYWNWRRWGEPRFAYGATDSDVLAGETMLAGVVAPPPHLDCPGETWDLEGSIRSNDPTDRYAAIRTAGIAERTDLTDSLVGIALGDDDWRIRLESTASLARIDPEVWTSAILDIALDVALDDQYRIEATFVLSELSTSQSADGLETIAASASACPSEIRAAAAWGLGQGSGSRPTSLLPLAIDDDLLVRLHAVVAIEDLPASALHVLRSWISIDEARMAATAAFLLQRHGRIHELLDAYESGGLARLWAINALGDLPEAVVREGAGDRLSHDLQKALLPLWMRQVDWVRVEGQAGVEALDVQKVRFDPSTTSTDGAPL